MKHKILATLLTAATIGTLGLSPVSVQAFSLDSLKGQLQNKGIIISGSVSSLDELKQKLEEMGIDCSNPNWIQVIIPGFPGKPPLNPDLPDDNQPENPEIPDNNQPETPGEPDDNQPESPDVPGDNQPELPDDNRPETPEIPDDGQPDNPELPGDGEPNNPELPGDGEPENPELPDGNQPEVPGLPDSNQPETPELPDNNQPENPGTDEEDTNAAFIREVAELVNAQRSKAGLSPLTVNTDVQAAAQVRAREIETSFSHTRPDGSTFSTALTQQGVSYRGSGENIAWGQKTPEQVMDGWMNSPGHRANILNKNFTSIGVGFYQNASGTNYWTQLFTY